MSLKDDIIGILKEHEDELSDGYGYYSSNVNETLGKIAEEILKSVEWESKLPRPKGRGFP